VADIAEAEVFGLPRSDREVPGTRVPGALHRGSVRDPEPEALFHGPGEVHRHIEQPAAARSRVVGE
jgi:hypothetical protein